MTLRVGLIGYPVGHSISPAFQQAAFDALGIDARYERWETAADSLGEVVGRLRQRDVLGANVTIPHKQAVGAYLDEIDPEARAVGAVNTIEKSGDRLIGRNTDVAGFARAVRVDGATSLEDQRVFVVGAGGAARAVVAAALRERAAGVVIAARRTEQARELVGDLARGPLGGGRTALAYVPLAAVDPRRDKRIAAAHVLVNATPVGMSGPHASEPFPIAPDRIRPGMLVVDLIYNPPLTPLLRLARDRGATTLNGLPMLIYQGAASFERWTGRDAPVALMRRAAEEALGA